MRVERNAGLESSAPPRDQRVDITREHDLERRARSGDIEAFGVLVERYSAAAYYMIYDRIQDKYASENAVIEAFCLTWRALQKPSNGRCFLRILSRAIAVAMPAAEEI